MKPIQWIIALVVLVAMVFLITFAMNFLGDSKPTPTPLPTSDGKTDDVLVFLSKSYPVQKENTPIVKYVDMEIKEEGYHDYVFVNPTGEEVKVGRTGKVCTCSGVELYLAPEEWKVAAARLLASGAAAGALSAAEAIGGAPDPLLALGGFALIDKELREAAANAKPFARLNVDAENHRETATVPPHAVGWFRMRWKGTAVEEKLFNAELWARQPKNTADIKLEAHVRCVEPVQYPQKEILISPDLSLDGADPGPGGDPKTLAAPMLVLWSTTRPSLNPKVEVLTPGDPKQSPVVVGKPKALPRDVLNDAPPVKPGQPKPGPWQVKCGYQIPIRVLDRSPDRSRPLPFGSFRVRFRVTFDDPDIEPIVFVLGGRLRGDIRVGTGDADRLDFGTFPAKEGSEQHEVTLYSDVPGLELEVDAEQTPPFLRGVVTKISPPRKTVTGETAWTVYAQIGPRQVEGAFPRDDDLYRDSAVYVKVKGSTSRSLRIPVKGSAN